MVPSHNTGFFHFYFIALQEQRRSSAGAVMKFSDKFAKVQPSATLAVNAKALELKAQGINIASLAVGEPDFPTPAHICQAAKDAIDAGFTRYTAVPGIMELRKAAGGYFKRQYGVDVAPECVVISNGGKQTLYNVMQALLNPGDEVIIPAPYWVSYPDMAALAGAVSVPVLAPVEAGFKVTPALLDAHVTPRTRMVIFNAPSNPTGALYTQAELDALMQWALDRGLFVISDEIYDQLVYDGESVSAIGWWQRHPESVAVCNGVAKSFAMTGWRVGYSVTAPALAKVISTLQGQCTSNVCSIAQKAALAALEGPNDCVMEMKKAFMRRRDLACEIIAGWSKAQCPKPGGAFYLFVDVHRYFRPGMANDVELCTLLLEKAHVAVVPGSAFGDARCIRFSYAVADDVLRDALERVGAVLEGK